MVIAIVVIVFTIFLFLITLYGLRWEEHWIFRGILTRERRKGGSSAEVSDRGIGSEKEESHFFGE